MFENRVPPEQDKILRLMGMFAADPRTDKVDLGVGVYRSPEGKTPVMAAVKTAEQRIWEAQETKGYVGLSGDPAFLDAMRGLILGDAVPAARVAACGTPGGTGAVRQVLEMTRRLSPDAAVWISDPTWPNHPAIIGHLAQKSATYRYYDRETGGIDRDGMLADLARTQAGDVILLHACCHNPTGADLTPGDWREIAAICQRTGAIPFVDMAYLGFAESLEADAEGTRHLCHEPAGGLHRRQLFQEFRPLPGARRRGPRRHRRRRPEGGRLRHARQPQPAELRLPARPRRAGGGDDPERPDTARRLAR